MNDRIAKAILINWAAQNYQVPIEQRHWKEKWLAFRFTEDGHERVDSMGLEEKYATEGKNV